MSKKNSLSGPWQFFLQSVLAKPALRRRLIFALKQDYFADLDLQIPLGKYLTCPWQFQSAIFSFVETFALEEYAQAFKHVPLPDRWLDIGCHAGYFSLYVALQKSILQGDKFRESMQALLIDADPRVREAVISLIEKNNLQACFQFAHGAIADLSAQQKSFSLRDVTSSQVIDQASSADKEVVSVATLSAAEIMQLLPPPYDLIKVDIEGAEFEFLEHYQKLLQETKFLVLEWHSWHKGGGGREQIKTLAEARGFAYITDVVPPHLTHDQEQKSMGGVMLFKRA